MEPVAINQGPCLTQQLTLTIVFFSFGALFAHTKSSQKENTNTLKWVQKNDSVAINHKCGQT